MSNRKPDGISNRNHSKLCENYEIIVNNKITSYKGSISFLSIKYTNVQKLFFHQITFAQ